MRRLLAAAAIALLWPIVTVLRVWDDLCIRYDPEELEE